MYNELGIEGLSRTQYSSMNINIIDCALYVHVYIHILQHVLIILLSTTIIMRQVRGLTCVATRGRCLDCAPSVVCLNGSALHPCICFNTHCSSTVDSDYTNII